VESNSGRIAGVCLFVCFDGKQSKKRALDASDDDIVSKRKGFSGSMDAFGLNYPLSPLSPSTIASVNNLADVPLLVPTLEDTSPIRTSSENQLFTQNHPTSMSHALSEDIKSKVLLDENLHVINVMRENLVTGKIQQNVELMIKFHSNISQVLNL
jgi:hypothetical protein